MNFYHYQKGEGDRTSFRHAERGVGWGGGGTTGFEVVST